MSQKLSVKNKVAEKLGLDIYADTMIRVIQNPAEADAAGLHLDFVQLSFSNTFISRCDTWRFQLYLGMTTVFLGKKVEMSGMEATVKEMLIGDKPAKCGVITHATKLTFRTRSAQVFWLVQMSQEMWEFSPDGELKFETFLNRFTQDVFNGWKALQCNHCLSIILFSRIFYDVDSIEELPEEMRAGAGVDAQGEHHNGKLLKVYRDFYKPVVMNSMLQEDSRKSVVSVLWEEFVKYPTHLGFTHGGSGREGGVLWRKEPLETDRQHGGLQNTKRSGEELREIDIEATRLL